MKNSKFVNIIGMNINGLFQMIFSLRNINNPKNLNLNRENQIKISNNNKAFRRKSNRRNRKKKSKTQSIMKKLNSRNQIKQINRIRKKINKNL